MGLFMQHLKKNDIRELTNMEDFLKTKRIKKKKTRKVRKRQEGRQNKETKLC
jgi:hypothetical protein